MRSAEENKLEKDLRRWFNKLQRKIQKLIDTYYDDELFFLHINKVYTIVEEMKPEYRAILLKHGLTQFYNARETTTTLYTIQQKKVSTKAGLYEPQLIREEDVGLFRTNPQIEDSLRYNTFQASDTTLARVTQNITNNLADSYHEGLGIRDAGRRITKEFAGLKGWESRRIARTEINSAQNEGAFSAYDELGVEYQMWWTGNDNRVRDSHRPLHGHIVAVGNTFSNGLLYPGDKSGPIKEWINCRCTSIPYIIPLGKMAPPGLTEFTEDQLIDIPGYRPVTVEDALNGEYPLEYFQENGVVDYYKNQRITNQLFSEDYDIPLDHSLSKAPFAVPTGDLSEFGISDNMVDMLQMYQKRRFGAEREYGFAFNLRNDKILTKEFRGGTNDIVILSPSKNHGTVHYHTEDGFNPFSHQDVDSFLRIKKEKVGIAMSKKETWIIQKTDLQKRFNEKEIKKITKEIKTFEENQKKKMYKEYEKKERAIQKIKNPQKRKLAQKEFNEYLNNEFLDKHNKELGDKILKSLKKNKDLKVKRIMNTPVNRRDIENFHDISIDKVTYNKYKNLKHSTPINSEANKRKRINTPKDEILLKNSSKILLSENELSGKLLNNLDKDQFKEYTDLRLELKKLRRKIKNTHDVEKIENYRKDIIKLSNQIEEYHALAFKGQHVKVIPKINKKEFVEDNQVGKVKSLENTPLENKQIKSQNFQMTDDEIMEVSFFGGDGFKLINGYIYDLPTWKEHIKWYDKDEILDEIKDINETCKLIDKVIAKSKGLTQKTTLHRYGYFDKTLNVGDTGIFEGYTSTSYQYEAAESYKYTSNDNYYIQILADENIKGFAKNDPRTIGEYDFEHEFILGRNQGYKVVEVDHKNKIAVIQLI